MNKKYLNSKYDQKTFSLPSHSIQNDVTSFRGYSKKCKQESVLLRQPSLAIKTYLFNCFKQMQTLIEWCNVNVK